MRRPRLRGLLLCLTAAKALQPLALITRRRTGRSGAKASVRSSADAGQLASVRSSDEKRPNLARTASAAALVAGTTVGGGFLGLPAVVKPAGFVPTVITLTASWLFLLAEALVVAEAVSRCRGQASLSTVAETAGASKLAVRGLFFALVTATLASQLSKAGTLLPVLSYRAATLAAAVAACLAALGPSTRRAADLNAVLTVVFAASACVEIKERHILTPLTPDALVDFHTGERCRSGSDRDHRNQVGCSEI